MEQSEKISIFLIGVFVGMTLIFFNNTLWDIGTYKITQTQTEQEILQLPNGTTWMKIRTIKDLKSEGKNEIN